MNLTNPSALFWASLAIPIVIFYILKIRLRRIPVSTVWFWERIFEEKQPRSIWQRLRHLLSLLLQLAFLMLLVSALAEPFFSWEIQQQRRLVLVFDNSASMRATDEQPSRFAKARQEALALVSSLRQRDEMAIVEAGAKPRVACGLTGHQRTLRDAIHGLNDSDQPTAVADAIQLARRLIKGHENGKIVVLSDACFENAEEVLSGDDIAWIPVGRRTANVGITRFQVRRSLTDPVGYQILVEVANLSAEPAEVRLEIDLDGRPVDVIPIRLESEGTWSNVFEKTSVEGGRLTAQLDQPDALEVDNVARAILPARERRNVVLVTEGNLFLQKVFEALPLVELTMTSEVPATVPDGTLLVLHRKTPATLPSGDVFVIEPAGSSDAWELLGKLDNPVVAEQDEDSPLMAHVRLDRVLMPEARRLKVHSRTELLAESAAGDPLYFAVERPSGKLLVLTVNLDRGDLPLRTAFPILASNALLWYAGTKGELRPSMSTGTVTDIQLSDALARPGEDDFPMDGQESVQLSLISPAGSTRQVPASGRTVTVGPLDVCGIWRVTNGSGEEVIGNAETQSEAAESAVEIACNVANRQESDLRRPENLSIEQPVLAAGFGGRPLWFYLLLTALVLSGTEWFLYQRRWIS